MALMQELLAWTKGLQAWQSDAFPYRHNAGISLTTMVPISDFVVGLRWDYQFIF